MRKTLIMKAEIPNDVKGQYANIKRVTKSFYKKKRMLITFHISDLKRISPFHVKVSGIKDEKNKNKSTVYLLTSIFIYIPSNSIHKCFIFNNLYYIV